MYVCVMCVYNVALIAGKTNRIKKQKGDREKAKGLENGFGRVC